MVSIAMKFFWWKFSVVMKLVVLLLGILQVADGDAVEVVITRFC